MKWLVILAAATMLGCDSVKPPIEGRMDPYVPAQVHFASDELRARTAITPPITSRDSAGLLYIMLPIRAATDEKLNLDYRVTFFDRNHQIVGRQSGWMTKTLSPNIPDQITTNSTGPGAADFQIDIRFAD